jgi:hypothetical protein
VTHLVDVDREDDAERELPAPDGPVHTRREEHAEERSGLRQTEQQQLGFREDEHDGELELDKQRAQRAEARRLLAPAGAVRRGSGLAVHGLAQRAKISPRQRWHASLPFIS